MQGGGGGPAQRPAGGPVLGGGDLLGPVLLGRLRGGEQAQEIVVAVTVSGGVGLEEAGIDQVLGVPGGLAGGQVGQ